MTTDGMQPEDIERIFKDRVPIKEPDLFLNALRGMGYIHEATKI